MVITTKIEEGPVAVARRSIDQNVEYGDTKACDKDRQLICNQVI